MIGKKITIAGDKVKGVGYRPFLLEKAVRLKIKNFDAINVESEDEIDNEKQVLIIYTSGKDKQITDFVEFVQSKEGRPRKAKVDSVVPDVYTEDVISISEYRTILNAEQQSKTVQGGLLIGDILMYETNKNLELLRTETNDNFDKMGKNFEKVGDKIDSLRTETNDNFGKMDKKYDKISKNMFDIVGEMKETNKLFEERSKISDMRMEKTEKSIERLLDILAKK